MENFIGNNAKFIVEWGQLLCGATLLLCLVLLRHFIIRSKRWWAATLKSIPILLLLLVSSLAFVRIQKIKPRITEVITALDALVGKKAPPLQMKVLPAFDPSNISEFEGHTVLLNFWATWCKPCLSELPELAKLQSDFEERGLKVIAISDEPPEKLKAFRAKHPHEIQFAAVEKFDWADIQSERPLSFLLDREGQIIEYFTGGYDYAHFAKKIVPHL